MAPASLPLQFNPHSPYEGHPEKYYDMHASEQFTGVGFQPRCAGALRESELIDDPVGNMRNAAAATTALHDRIDPMLGYLDRQGLSESTLVIFVADNGHLHGTHALWNEGEAAWPPVMYEEVIRVPMLLRWPGTIPSGITRKEFVVSTLFSRPFAM